MKPYILLSICLLALLSSYGQEMVSLRSIPFRTQKMDSVYVQSVIDERTVKRLGVLENVYAEPIELFLKEGAEKAVKTFYGLSFKKDGRSTPIYIKLKELNVQESKRRMNKGIARVARVHVEMIFCEKRDGLLKGIFSIKHNEDDVFGLYDKAGVYATHEKRIRAALEYCMHAFSKAYRQAKPLVPKANFKPIKENEAIEQRLGQWFNLITLKGMRSRYFEGYGISYTGFVDSKKGLIRPYETSFEVTWARPGIAEENGYSDVNSFVFRPELYFLYKKLFKGVYASASGNVPIGYEIVEDLNGDNSFNFVIGIGASQGLRIIPWQKNGLVFGVDFFQQLETSKVYTFDLGVELVLGINF